MKLAVISDTHWSRWKSGDPIVQSLTQRLAVGYDAIWHGGDVIDELILEELEMFAPLVCVKGNCDSFIGRYLPHQVTETIEGVKLGMIHGWDLPLDHALTVSRAFADDTDIIIHGHTHKRRYQEFTRADGSKVTIINPGSVSSPRGGETPGFGELLIENGQFEYQSFALRDS